MAAIDRLSCDDKALCESESNIASIAYVSAKRPVCMISVSFMDGGGGGQDSIFECLIVVIFNGKRYDTFHFI